MTGALKKDVNTTYTPGSPGVPGTPGSPYIPAKPAHTEWRPTVYRYDGRPQYFYEWTTTRGRRGSGWHPSDIPDNVVDLAVTIKSPLDLLSAIVGVKLTYADAHYTEVRGLITIGQFPLPMIMRWTAPWVTMLREVAVPGTPAVPAVAPTPGVPATAATTSHDFNIGWNSGARSVVGMPLDCAYTFSADPSSVGIVTGLNDFDNDPGYGEIDFGVYLNVGMAQVYENGVSKSVPFSFGSADTFVIQRRGSTITYAHNGAVFYTSSKPSTSEVFADVSMYMGGDSITAASFGALELESEPPPPTMHAEGAFMPLAGSGGDVSSAAGAGTLAPLTGRGFVSTLAPSYAIGSGTLSYLTGYSISLTGGLGSGEGSFLPLTGGGGDYNHAIGEGSLQPLTGFGGSATEWREWSWSASADLVMPGPFIVEARATRHPLNTLEARMPRFTLEAFGGAQLRATMPMPTLQATGTGVVIGRINATMPMPTLEASGITGSVGRIDATLRGGFTLEAYGGAVIEAILQDGFTLQASGTTGAVGRLTATMPMFELEAHASADQVGRIDATMPMIRPVASAVLDVLMPMFRLVASGHAVVAVEYEAYTMNLVGPVDLDPRSPHSPSGREITRYTHFPFDQIVRHGDKYYGVSSTGLYLLGGDTDDGAPIPWAFRTATTDFGTIQRKTVVSAYLGGKVMPTATARIIAGEQGEITYTYPVPPSATNQNYRVRFGRGLKTRYFALEMADARGGDVRADSIDFEINTMTRAL